MAPILPVPQPPSLINSTASLFSVFPFISLPRFDGRLRFLIYSPEHMLRIRLGRCDHRGLYGKATPSVVRLGRTPRRTAKVGAIPVLDQETTEPQHL